MTFSPNDAIATLRVRGNEYYLFFVHEPQDWASNYPAEYSFYRYMACNAAHTYPMPSEVLRMCSALDVEAGSWRVASAAAIGLYDAAAQFMYSDWLVRSVHMS